MFMDAQPIVIDELDEIISRIERRAMLTEQRCLHIGAQSQRALHKVALRNMQSALYRLRSYRAALRAHRRLH